MDSYLGPLGVLTLWVGYHAQVLPLDCLPWLGHLFLVWLYHALLCLGHLYLVQLYHALLCLGHLSQGPLLMELIPCLVSLYLHYCYYYLAVTYWE